MTSQNWHLKAVFTIVMYLTKIYKETWKGATKQFDSLKCDLGQGFSDVTVRGTYEATPSNNIGCSHISTYDRPYSLTVRQPKQAELKIIKSNVSRMTSSMVQV